MIVLESIHKFVLTKRYLPSDEAITDVTQFLTSNERLSCYESCISSFESQLMIDKTRVMYILLQLRMNTQYI